MKKIFSVFRLDLKSLTKNLIVFVVVIGITILPALYAWFNIAANWDPYSNTGYRRQLGSVFQYGKSGVRGMLRG